MDADSFDQSTNSDTRKKKQCPSSRLLSQFYHLIDEKHRSEVSPVQKDDQDQQSAICPCKFNSERLISGIQGQRFHKMVSNQYIK